MIKAEKEKSENKAKIERWENETLNPVTEKNAERKKSLKAYP